MRCSLPSPPSSPSRTPADPHFPPSSLAVITLDEVVYADLSTVLAGGSSPFGPCAAYIDQMYAIGGEMNIPPIMIAAFAMQESTCNPNAVGGGGEQGMFQISQDKCGGARASPPPTFFLPLLPLRASRR